MITCLEPLRRVLGPGGGLPAHDVCRRRGVEELSPTEQGNSDDAQALLLNGQPPHLGQDEEQFLDAV